MPAALAASAPVPVLVLPPAADIAGFADVVAHAAGVTGAALVAA